MEALLRNQPHTFNDLVRDLRNWHTPLDDQLWMLRHGNIHDRLRRMAVDFFTWLSVEDGSSWATSGPRLEPKYLRSVVDGGGRRVRRVGWVRGSDAAATRA